jgi:hypothetical protein
LRQRRLDPAREAELLEPQRQASVEIVAAGIAEEDTGSEHHDTEKRDRGARGRPTDYD